MSDKFVKTLKPLTGDDPNPCYKLEASQLHAVMLRLELSGGACFALPYAHLTSVALKPPSGIELQFTTHRVLLQGRNLAPLFELLSRNRVEALREHTVTLDRFPEGTTVITSLIVQPNQ
jgi:hypothetical protein